jgi:glycosyltransferase involved in cell wall biosynthesis
MSGRVTTGLVTTIVPVFNRPTQLVEAVDSVLAQSYRPIEVVVVDDGSTDTTPDVVRALARGHGVRALRQPNAGPGAARNAGLVLARGEYIQYLDSDDRLHPRKFELQVQALREHPEAGVAYCISLREDTRTGRVRQWARTAQRIEHIFPEFLMARGWDTNAPLWRRSVCDAIGPFGDFRCLEDWEHDLRAGMLGVVPVHVAEALVTVRDHDAARASGMDTGFTPQLTREFYRAHRAVWARMRERGLTDWAYLREFSRKMFWIARMCGERGLEAEAEEALACAAEMVSTHHRPRELQLYRSLARWFGWRRTVAVTERVRRWLRPRRDAALA